MQYLAGHFSINIDMIFGILTLITALTIAGVAAWFSIAGLMAIFSAAAMPIAIMAGTLEVGKLLTASWLYRYWHDTGIALKTYLSTAVLVLMLITSMGIFGYLSKAHLDQAGVSGDAIAAVERIDGQIAREENKIDILQDRINGLTGGTSTLSSDAVAQQENIRAGAWQQVQGDIDYNQQQITSVRNQLTTDLAALDDREAGLDSRLTELDRAVNELRNKGVETIETDSGGVFRSAKSETIDYVAQANQLRETQQSERDDIAKQKQDLNSQRASLRTQANADIKTFQGAIDRYRAQAQTTIDKANAEINRLRNASTQSQDDTLAQIDDYNNQIDSIYNNIASLKEEKFEAESIVRGLEKEVGPIKYVAQLLFGGDGEELLDKAVQVFILLLVFVFDPLAVMLVIAANQTLLRYGINLEKAGPDDDGSNPPGRANNTDPSTSPSDDPRAAADKTNSEDTSQGSDTTDNNTHLQSSGTTGKYDSSGSHSEPSSVDDAATAIMEGAAQQAQSKKKEEDLINDTSAHTAENTITEKDNEAKLKRVEAKLKKLQSTNRSLKADLVAEQSKPAKIVEKEIKVEDTKKISELEKKNNALQKRIEKLSNVVKDLEAKEPEVVEVERIVKEAEVVEKEASGDLKAAARLMASSELNKEDLSESEIFELLQKSSEEEVKRKIGFWAMPLPKKDEGDTDTNKVYIGKK